MSDTSPRPNLRHSVAASTQPSQRRRAPGTRSDSDDDFSSDDDLSESDLRVLNSGFAPSQAFAFYPSHPQSDRACPAGENGNFSAENERGGIAIGDEGPLRNTTSRTRYHAQQHPTYRHQSRRSTAYQYPRMQPRPLIEYIKNEWREASLNPSHSQVYDDRYDPSVCLQMLCAPRLKRVWLIAFTVLVVLYCNWKFWAEPKMNERFDLNVSAAQRLENAEGWFGANVRPEFKDLVHVEVLDQALLPKAAVGPGEAGRRLVFIGDVHGCNDELNELLTTTNYNPATDHLVFLGDMISKGPNSLAVLDIAIANNASCVRGNHEDRILLTSRDISTQHHITLPQKRGSDPQLLSPRDALTSPKSLGNHNTDPPLLDLQAEEDSAYPRLDPADRTLAQQLLPHHLSYLSSCPTILDIGPIPSLGGYRVHAAHAGLIPHIGLQNQDPLSVMEMRTVDLLTHVPSPSSKGTPWYRLWNKYQDLLPKEKAAIVIYGHDSKRGLQLRKWTKGLDTGCVRGGKLTALVLDAGEGEGGDADDGTMTKWRKQKQKEGGQVVSVKCKDYRALEKETRKNAATSSSSSSSSKAGGRQEA